MANVGHTCPVTPAPTEPPTCSLLKFGRMSARSGDDLTDEDRQEMIKSLVNLGLCMNDPTKCGTEAAVKSPEDSTIPAGYTYLGQFIAHEITFDNTKNLPPVELTPENLRSPGIDLDSLYGPEQRDEQSKKLYEDNDPARLKVGTTVSDQHLTFENDLPRDEKTKKALVGDERNDENLALAQTHVAFIKFHNKVVDKLKDTCPHQIPGFPHHDLPAEKKSITVRNLLRGFALGLPSGEKVAERMGETPLRREDVLSGPHEKLLSAPAFKGQTPLWYYILKEAELKGKQENDCRLGHVGSRIVAETLVGLIKNSRYSILDDPKWRPAYGRTDLETSSVGFKMVDLLHIADVVDPLGEHFKKVYGH